jgi:hypothetical protein
MCLEWSETVRVKKTKESSEKNRSKIIQDH